MVSPDPEQASAADLVVEVRPAYRCHRWAWYLVDRRTRSEFETEFDYVSASEARRAGFTRLAELTAFAPGATIDDTEVFANAA